jgi:hypothetical protein
MVFGLRRLTSARFGGVERRRLCGRIALETMWEVLAARYLSHVKNETADAG